MYTLNIIVTKINRYVLIEINMNIGEVVEFYKFFKSVIGNVTNKASTRIKIITFTDIFVLLFIYERKSLELLNGEYKYVHIDIMKGPG